MSPAATISQADASVAILTAADSLFYERGIGGVTMTMIRDDAGVSLRRLYALYPSKGDLVAAWLADRHDKWMAWFTSAVDRHVAAGSDSIAATFDALREWATSDGYRGCAFINSRAETSEVDESHREIIAGHKRSLLNYLSELLTHDHPTADARTAQAVAVLIDGAIVQTAILGEYAAIDAAQYAATRLLEAS